MAAMTNRLDRSEEASLARLVRRGDPKAKLVLVDRNLPLVFHIARRFKGPLPIEDRIQEGVTGLIRAAERFLPEKGVRFGTYASWWIRQAISRAIANQSRDIRLPVQMHVRLRRIEKETEHLERKLGRNPTQDELSREMGFTRRKLSSYARMSSPTVSLNSLPGDGESSFRGSEGGEGPVAPLSPEKTVMDSVLRNHVVRSLQDLNPRERFVVGRRFGLFGGRATTLNGIAHELGLSRERIRQIVKQALRKIRESEVAPGLRDFY